MSAGTSAAAPAAGAVSFTEATRLWWRVGWLSFGGPAAQIALMHRLLVDERRWLSEKEFLDALGFCMLLPGPEAMQLATYAGWKLHGTRGGLVAGLLFVLPGALIVLALSIAYAAAARLPVAGAILDGIRAAGLALVLEAMVRMSRRALGGPGAIAIAAASFVAIFAFAVPFPVIVAAAAGIGFLRPRRAEAPAGAPARVPFRRTLRVAATWLALWVAPLVAVAMLFGPGHLIAQLAWFFSKLALVTFGGAYAVLAYMSQEVVTGRGWLAPAQMLDGLGLAETTPGPLILVTEFVGFVAAHRAHPGAPYAYGVLGAAVALWATFVPCFLWIFTGAPYVEWLGTRPRLQAALAAITAAVLGVIANLSLWFGLHVLFARVVTWRVGPLQLAAPDWASVEWRMVALVAASAVLLMRFRLSVHAVLALAALAAVLTAALAPA